MVTAAANCTVPICLQLLSHVSNIVVIDNNQPLAKAQPIRFKYQALGSNVVGLNSFALQPGSSEPRLAAGQYRLYSMRFCPFAHRVLLALARKSVPVEVVNVNPDRPPQWYLGKTPQGQVPALEINGKVVWESNVIVEYLDDLFPSSRILPRDAFEKAHQKILVERLAPLINCLFDFYANAHSDNKLESALRVAESLLADKQYFGGRLPSYADYMLWPFVERLQLITMSPATRLFRYFPGAAHPRFGAYMARMQSLPEVKFTTRPLSHHRGYLDSVAASRPNYDFGII